MNIFSIVEQRARERPHGVALISAEQAFSFAELVELARRTAGALRQRGVGESDLVGVMLGNTSLHLLVLLALARLGAVAVSLSPTTSPESLDAFCTGFKPKLILGLTPDRALQGSTYLQVGTWIEQPCDAAERGLPHASGGDRLLKIALSSGTTGTQKAVGWSHQRMLDLLALQRSLRPFGPGVRMLPLMGFDATVAIDTSLRQLCAGGAVVPTRRIGHDALVHAVDRLGATHVLSSPGIMGRLLKHMPVDAQRFPDLGGLRLTGGLVSPELRASLLRRVTSKISVDYGASEVGVLAAGDPDSFQQAPQAVGRIVPWVQAETVDGEGRPLPVGEQGRLRFRSAGFPAAYLGGGGPILDAEGWFSPGDIGRIDPGGLLVVAAREDELINIGGMKVMPAEIENVLTLCPGVEEAAAYAVQTADGHQVLLAAVVCSEPYRPSDILARCRQALGQRAPSHLVRVGRLPRNTMGKVVRRELVRNTRVKQA